MNKDTWILCFIIYVLGKAIQVGSAWKNHHCKRSSNSQIFPSASQCYVVGGEDETRSRETSRNAKSLKSIFLGHHVGIHELSFRLPGYGSINYPWAWWPCQPSPSSSHLMHWNDIWISIPLLPHEERLAYKNVDIIQNKRRHPKASVWDCQGIKESLRVFWEPYHRVPY